MPMIKFQCNNPECDNHINKLYNSSNEVPPFLDCGACGTGKLERTIAAPSSKSTQFVDNGHQARRVEVMQEVIEKETEKLHKDE